jgi:hypothetical protein
MLRRQQVEEDNFEQKTYDCRLAILMLLGIPDKHHEHSDGECRPLPRTRLKSIEWAAKLSPITMIPI